MPVKLLNRCVMQTTSFGVMLHCGGGNLKKQLKRADKVGASVALLIGSEEMAAQQVTLKPLRGNGEQARIALSGAASSIT